MNICLFVAITSEKEGKIIDTSIVYFIKKIIYRLIDMLFWNFSVYSLHYHAWERRYNTNKGDIALRHIIRQQLTAAFAGQKLTFTEIGWLDLDLAAAREIGRTQDLFVIAGSGYLRFTDDHDLPPRLKRDAETLAAITCPKIAYGIGINQRLMAQGDDVTMAVPIFPDATLTVLRAIFRQLDAISVRDEATRRIVATVATVPVVLMGDPVLFDDVNPPLSFGVMTRPPKIGLNIALHEGPVIARLADSLPVYLAFLKRMQNESGAEIHYIQHTDAERVIPRMMARQGLRITAHDVGGAALLDLYRSLDLHVCEMLHSSIMGCSAGIPVITIPYDVKNRSFFALMNLTSFMIAPASLTGERLWAVAQEALASRYTLPKALRSRIEELRVIRDGFLGAVQQLAEERSQIR